MKQPSQTFLFPGLKALPFVALVLVATSCGQFRPVARGPHHGRGHQGTHAQGGGSNGGGQSNTGAQVTDLKLQFSTPPLQVPNKFAANIPYSNSTAATFDIFLPKGEATAPLVVFIHGGGFRNGAKEVLYKKFAAETTQLLEHGYGVATVSYRFMTDGPDGVMNCLGDMRRCLQFIRYHAAELHVDPARIACFGVSAGAGGSIWLATHDDMADPASADPVARQSTRLWAVAGINTQSTYDICRWDDIFYPVFHFHPTDDPRLQEEMMTMYSTRDYGLIKTDPRIVALRKDLDMLGLMDHSDPPMWLDCDRPGEKPVKTGAVLHHPIHEKTLMETAQAQGISIMVEAPGLNLHPAKPLTLVEFLEQQLDR